MVLGGMARYVVVLSMLCWVLDSGCCHPRFGRATRDELCSETNDSLFLTQHVDSGDINRARTESIVSLFTADHNIPDVHSGYITVNKSADTNLFFMLAKGQSALDNTTSPAPLLLWLQGGPGQTSLFGQFVEHGLLGLDGNGSFYRRNHTLWKLFDVVYLDEPVGAGYSFTRDLTHGFAKTVEDMSRYILEFLRQFLILFPEYHGRDFYVAGESYGSRPALTTAYCIHKEPSKVNLTLKGVINGVGFWSSVMGPLHVSSYFSALGLLDHNGYKTFSERVSNISALVSKGMHLEACMLMAQTFRSSSNKSNPTLYQELTGYEFCGNVLEPKEPPVFTRFNELAVTPWFKKAIHVGKDGPFRQYELYIHGNLVHDPFRDLGDMAVEVLNNYKVLVYVGQLDPTFARDQTEVFFRNLSSWTGAEEFTSAHHKIWYINEDDTHSAGYVTRIGNFTYVKLARVGHYPAFDQPQAVTEMFFQFVNDRFV
ncbi:probable serine carboxypeptidase CPVL [Ornithodoros turicata]|uniref:probable serine carboxypeptidase CPVL n=1 Tax=Ornithodoros turicata TaxID=34597 RepID=UPI003139132E